MPTSKRASIADVLKDVDDLLASVANNAELLGDIDAANLRTAVETYRPRVAKPRRNKANPPTTSPKEPGGPVTPPPTPVP